MASIRKALKNWVRDKNAMGLIVLLSRSDDPLAVLHTYRERIDEKAIEELVLHSYYTAKTESIDKGLSWAEVARQASLIGGGAKEYADCLDLRASLLQQLSERQPTANKPSPADSGTLLNEALACAMEALSIYEEASLTECIPMAYGRVSVINRELGNLLPALEHRILSMIGWTQLADAADAMPKHLDDLEGLFWSLKRRDFMQAAELLINVGKTLERTTPWLDEGQRGRLFDMLGAACGKLDRDDEACGWWTQAITQYRIGNHRQHEFETWRCLQEHAYEQTLPEKVVEYGRQGIERAPEDVDSQRLGYCYQLVAFAHSVMDQPSEAITAYHQAADFYLQNNDSRSLAAPCLLDVGILEKETGKTDEAQRDLERVLELSAGALTYWLAQITLAELYWRQRGNLGAAIKIADQAVHASIADPLGFAERAVSHFLSGILYFTSGDSERALVRFEAVLEILAEGADAGTAHTGPLSGHDVVPPSKADVALLSLVASAKLQRKAEMEFYLELYRSLGPQADADEPTEDAQQLLTVDQANLIRGMRMVARADSLAITDPKQAITLLETALPLLQDSEQILIIAHRDLGIAKLCVEELDSSRACFNYVLRLLAQRSDVFEEITCHVNLGQIEARLGNMNAAYDHFLKVIKIKEAQRTSLGQDEQRFLFLENAQHVYLMFLGVCLELGRFREAMETVEKVKSRVLMDLLGQSSKRPIDYRSLTKIRELKETREVWDKDLLLETGTARRSKIDELVQADSEKAWDYLYTPIRLSEEIETIEKYLQEHNFLLDIESQSTFLEFGEIRELCRHR